MKKVLFVCLLAMAAFAGKGKQIDLLRTENDKLRQENKSLTGTITKLENDTAALGKTISDLNKKISSLEQAAKEKDILVKQYTDELQKLRSQKVSTAPTKTVEPKRQIPVVKYPITGSVMDKRDHDASSVATRIVFYNGSAQHLQGFTANLRFFNNGQFLHECVVDVNQVVNSGENCSWYGAIPYDMTDAGNQRFYNLPADNLQVEVEVHKIITTSGNVKNFLK